MFDDPVERPLGAEGPHMQLVQDVVGERATEPYVCSPRERRRVDDLGAPMDALRLEP